MGSWAHRIGNLLFDAVLAVLIVSAVIVMLPIVLPVLVVVFIVSLVLSALRGEPDVELPGAELRLFADDGEDPLDLLSESEVIRRRSGPESNVIETAEHEVLISSPATATWPIRIRMLSCPSTAPRDGDEAEILIGPWEYTGWEFVDYGNAGEAVAAAVAYLENGIEVRVIKERAEAFLFHRPSGFWWKPGEKLVSALRQEWFRELPGRPATVAEEKAFIAAAMERAEDPQRC